LASADNIEIWGVVTEVLGGGKFRVLADGQTVLVHLSGKMRQNHIRVILGDRVLLEVSPYDLTRGRITRRKTE